MEPTHTYKLGLRGRSFRIDPRNGSKHADIACSACGEKGTINLTALPPPEIIDKKLVQRGWELDPNVCPDCVTKKKRAKAAAREAIKKEQKTMNVATTKPVGPLADNPALKAVSADLHKATAKMHQLLAIHFDVDEGRFAEGWNDERIAKESGIVPVHVTEVRNVAYGELKEPEEIATLRRDIKALNELITETLVAAQKEVNLLNNRVTEINKKLGIK
jgi:hypothetical protein